MANLRGGLCGLCFVRVCVCNKLFTSRDDDHISSPRFLPLLSPSKEDLDRRSVSSIHRLFQRTNLFAQSRDFHERKRVFAKVFFGGSD